MRLFTVVALSCGLLASGPVHALTLDLRKLSCEEFLKQDKDFHGQILMWLSGYALGEDDEPVLDFDQIVAVGQKLGAYCAKNSGSNVMTAYENAAK